MRGLASLLAVLALASAGAAGTAPAEPAQAMQIFGAACNDTLPDFKGAEKKAKAAGLAKSGADLVHPERNLQLRLTHYDNGNASCAVTFKTRAQPEQVFQAIAALPGVDINTSNGMALVYVKGDVATAILSGDNATKLYTLNFLHSSR